MLEFIKLSLICVMMDAESSYLEQIFLYEDKYSQNKVKVTSYFAESSSNELQPWSLDYEEAASYTKTNNGMIAFTIPYNYISEDEEQYDNENDAVLNYFINPDNLRIRVTYIDQELDTLDFSGYCIEQKQR